jgi:hypothetical protein
MSQFFSPFGLIKFFENLSNILAFSDLSKASALKTTHNLFKKRPRVSEYKNYRVITAEQ